MPPQASLEQLERQIAQLPPLEQLELVARVSARLSSLLPSMWTVVDKRSLRRQREREADALLAMCDTAAKMWVGEFDAAAEVRQMRQDRDERL